MLYRCCSTDCLKEFESDEPARMMGEPVCPGCWSEVTEVLCSGKVKLAVVYDDPETGEIIGELGELP